MPICVSWNGPWNTRTLLTLGGLFSSMVVSMLVKSMCKRSNEVMATIRCRGTLGKLPSCCKQCMQDLIDCCIWLVIPGHQKCSHSNDKVQLWPWWPASLWHLATWWVLGTMNSSRSLVLALGIECRYKAPQWITKFCWFCKISQPSSLEVCSARSAFKSVFFCAFSQSKTALNIGYSLWASAQSVICICTSPWPVVTHTCHSKLWSPSAMVGSWTSAQCTAPSAILSSMDLTMSGSSWVMTWLSTSAAVLSCPLWYSNSKLNCTRDLTHQWPVASRLGVVIM